MSKAQANTPEPILPFPGSELPAEPIERPRKRKSAAADSMLDDHLPPNLGKPLTVKVPDFSDPNRPKTCLEVDFPLVPINALSSLEGNAGKPIYQMSKWWARRRSCIFRALLLAAAMEAPVRRHPDGQPMLGPEGKPIIDEDVADQVVWDAYYANHQAAGNFKHLKVLDPFMGGGTTLVEGSRLGFQVAGVDLNPVAWFIVKNELACADPKEVKAFFDQIEAEVKPQIQPFYVTDGVSGRKGTWYKVNANGGREKMPAGFDPITLPPDQHKDYQYEGPEVIYTFWAKHGPCIKHGCGHCTPIFRSPIVATKRLGVKYIPCTCKNKACGITFHAELGDARIAPDAEHVVLENEHPYTAVSPGFAKGLLDYNKGTRKEQTERIKALYEAVEQEVGFKCPRCGTWSGQTPRDILKKHHTAETYGEIDKKHLGIVPARNSKKPVYCTLLIDPEWLKGSPGEEAGRRLGGFIDAPIDATEAWYRERRKHLRLIEVRGVAGEGVADANDENSTTPEQDGTTEEANDDADGEKSWIPETITLHDGRVINTRSGTRGLKSDGKPMKASFRCSACGQSADILQSVAEMNARERVGQPESAHQCASCRAVAANHHPAPLACYLLQCYDPARDAEGHPYGGRYFKVPTEADIERLVAAEREWVSRKETDLAGMWPKAELPHVWTTHGWALPEHGYTHWYKMFNARQLLIHAMLVQQCAPGQGVEEGVRLQGLGAVQQYLRNQNLLCIWNEQADKLEPFLSNPYMRPRNTTVECNLAASLGRGNWIACAAGVVEGTADAICPVDTVIGSGDLSNKKVCIGDRVVPSAIIRGHSSSDLPDDWGGTLDLAITDPPFGENITYADMADFFYVWLRLVLKQDYPEQFDPPFVPQTLEAISNPFRNPGMVEDGPDAGKLSQADAFYLRMMTECWAETGRTLKPGGILAFTFHHDKDATWTLVLRSLFDAGFYLEATYPVVSDETKGENAAFGAQKMRYDMIHVCRKRLLEDPKPVSWPKMRQWVKAEMSRLRPLLESFKSRGLSDADVRVILRGKALEFYGRHYGKVMVSAPGGEDSVLSIRDALLGINQLLDELSSTPGERPPSIVQPVVHQYLRLFGSKPSYHRDDVSKLLRGTAIQPRDFEHTGSTPWIVEEDKIVTRVPIYARFQKMRQRSRRELKTELDQAHFLIGAAMPVKEGDTGVNIEKELERETFLIRPGVEALLDWYTKTPAGTDEPSVPKAAGIALQLLRAAFEAHRARMAIEQPWLSEEWKASLETVI